MRVRASPCLRVREISPPTAAAAAIQDASGHPAAAAEGQEPFPMPCVASASQGDGCVGLRHRKWQQVPAVGQKPPSLQSSPAGRGADSWQTLKAAFCLWRVGTLCFLSLKTIINNFMISPFTLNCY